MMTCEELLNNTKGDVYYGIHFYPGVAQYQDSSSQEPYRVFLNEDTIQAMDPTFAGRPVFVEHVEDVNPSLDALRKEVDGWVIESFYNAADGKHWVKFLIVSEKGKKAVQSGMRLSNAYMPKSFGEGGLWNGVPYAKQVLDAEYDHLAIVHDPRYEESVIMSPQAFKQYNEENLLELKKLSNSKKGATMKFNFFKKTRVENAIDPELQVILPKSQKEITLTRLINDADEMEMDKNAGLADMSHKVKMKDGLYCNVGELLEKHDCMKDELEEMKKKNEEEMDLDTKKESVDSESSDMHNTDMEHPEKEVHDDMDDMEAKKSAMKLAEHEDKEIEEAKKDSKKKNEIERMAKVKADRLRHAHLNSLRHETHGPVIELAHDKIKRGLDRYGSL